ncbi:MAG: V4R domain-containing protein [Candidatus Hodarchaeales archaeon]
MIREVFIFHKSGISVFHKILEEDKTKLTQEIDNVIFASVSSAISNLMKELGHDNLQVIEVGSGKLFYSSSNDLFFVVHATTDGGEIIGPYLLKQLEAEFTETFHDLIKKKDWKIVETATFRKFNKNVDRINDDLKKLYEKNPKLFRFFSAEVPLSRIKELHMTSASLIKGFPMNTIRLVRRIDKIYGDEIKQDAYYSLGRYFGHEISKREFKNKIGINPSDVLKLLREISVAKYDSTNERFTLLICPICRGKTSEKTSCHFFAGFIQGCFDNPKIVCTEVQCKAKGDKNCIFQIIR